MTLRHSARVSGQPSFGIGRASDGLMMQGFIVPAIGSGIVLFALLAHCARRAVRAAAALYLRQSLSSVLISLYDSN